MSDCPGCEALKDANRGEVERLWKLVDELRTENRRLVDSLRPEPAPSPTNFADVLSEPSEESNERFAMNARLEGVRLCLQPTHEIAIEEEDAAEASG